MTKNLTKKIINNVRILKGWEFVKVFDKAVNQPLCLYYSASGKRIESLLNGNLISTQQFPLAIPNLFLNYFGRLRKRVLHGFTNEC